MPVCLPNRLTRTILLALAFADAGPADAGPDQPVALSPAQEERLRDHVARDGAEVFASPAPVGVRLPLAAGLEPLPGFLMMELPGLRTLRYARLASGFALVDGDTRIVLRVFSAAPPKPAP